MRLPDPIANTTTEAYLAYKAGVLAEGDLKPKLYEPYIHLDAWLAYWTGLSFSYPVKGVGKNLFDKDKALDNYFYTSTGSKSTYGKPQFYNNKFSPKSNKITMSFSAAHDRQSGSNIEANVRIVQYDASGNFISRLMSRTNGHTFTLDDNTESFILSVDNGPDAWFDDLQVEYGSTPTAYEPYTGEPEMLTDEEAYIAYLSGVTDTYPEEFRDPADIRVAAYLRYLISARFGRPEYPVTNEELYLSMLKTKYIPSGDPSSDITIEGTCKAPFVDVKMYGDTYQQSYTGKNLLDIQDNLRASDSGLNFSFSNNELTVSGTPTRGWANVTSNINVSLPAGKYTLSLSKQLTYRVYLHVVYTDDTSADVLLINAGETSKTITLAKDVSSIRLDFSMMDTGVTIEESFSVQLEAGATATSFEPFVGGVYSPNLDYPQPVQTVTGRQKVRVVGKNLFVPPESGNNKGVTYTRNEDGTFDIYGKATGGESLVSIFVDEFDIQSGDSLTLSCTHPNQGIRYRVEAYNGAAWLVSLISQISIMPTTITIPDNANRLRFSIGVQEGDEIDLKNVGVQLEKGTATAYEPYSSNDYEINLGKNLWSATTLVTGYYKFADGGLVTGGNPNYVTSIEKIDVTAGESYHISADKGAGVAGSGCVFFNNDTFVSSLVNPSGSNFTVPEGANKMAFNFFDNAGLSPSEVTHIQLEAGSTATDYAPYFEPIELCKIGTYQDYIYKSDGEWKVHKATVKKVLNGSEGWHDSTVDSTAGYFRGSVSLGGYKTTLGYSNKILVRQGSHGSYEYVWLQNLGTGSTYLQVLKSRLSASTIEAFEEFLTSNNITIYAVPYDDQADTTITNQNLINQLEALVSGGAENGTTYIKVNATDPNLPGLLYVEAPKYD